MNINIYQKNANSTVSNFKALAMGSKLLGPIDSKSLLRPRVKDTHLDHTHNVSKDKCLRWKVRDICQFMQGWKILCAGLIIILLVNHPRHASTSRSGCFSRTPVTHCSKWSAARWRPYARSVGKNLITCSLYFSLMGFRSDRPVSNKQKSFYMIYIITWPHEKQLTWSNCP